jgi:hypothetical protein
MRSVFGSEGSLRDVDLLPAFVALWRGQESGRLDFARAGVAVAFDLREGDVVAVSTTDPRFDAAAVLVRAGKLEASTLERLATPGGLTPALAALQAGILTKREWRWGEKIRAIEILTDLIGWPEGRYRFDRDFSAEPSEFHLPVPRLLLELFLRSRDEDLIRDALGDENMPLHRSSSFEEEFSSFGLTADAESVVRLIDGRSSVADISRQAPADEFAVRKLLAALAVLGLARTEKSGPRGIVAAPELPAEEPMEEEHPAATVQIRRSEELAPLDEVEVEAPPPIEERFESREEFSEPERYAARDLPAAEERFRTNDRLGEEFSRSTYREPEHALPPVEEAEVEVRPSWDIEPPEQGAAELSIDDGPGPVVAEPETRRRGGGPALFGLLLFLAAVIGGVLWWRSRQVPAATAALPAPTEVAAPIAATEPPAVATAIPSPAPAVVAPTLPPRPVPTARVASAPAPPPVASDASRRPWDERAQRDRRRLTGEKATRYTIQLMLACEIPSLSNAWKHDRPAGTMWLLPHEHRGRACYRVLWGRYPSLEAASAAQSTVPGHFRQGANRPAVIDAQKTLLP